MVLVAFKTTTGVRIQEFNYFNYAARTKIVPPTIPPFYEYTLMPGEQFNMDEGKRLEFSIVRVSPAN